MQYLQGRKAVAAVVVVAVLFGVVTMVTGTRVLLGADPGYAPYPPLLWFNTMMGAVYVIVGVLAWCSLRRGMQGAGIIFAVNLASLAVIGILYAPDGPIAVTSLQAMTLRTVVWLVLFLVLWWSSRRKSA
ncbi:MAG: hypothetical protein O3A84_06930 [Proteobacteria bacterium]|nr:hypothetical protein [Pseudomonadota bacterium]